MIEADLYSHLLTEVPLVNERVYPLVMPQDCKKPALVYSVPAETDKQSLNSSSAYDVRHRFQIDVYGESYLEVKTIKEQVKAALYSFSSYPHNLSVFEGHEPKTKLFRQTLDFNF